MRQIVGPQGHEPRKYLLHQLGVTRLLPGRVDNLLHNPVDNFLDDLCFLYDFDDWGSLNDMRRKRRVNRQDGFRLGFNGSDRSDSDPGFYRTFPFACVSQVEGTNTGFLGAPWRIEHMELARSAGQRTPIHYLHSKRKRIRTPSVPIPSWLSRFLYCPGH